MTTRNHEGFTVMHPDADGALQPNSGGFVQIVSSALAATPEPTSPLPAAPVL